MLKVPLRLVKNVFFMFGVVSVTMVAIANAQQVDVPDDYETIQAAINAIADNPSLGDTILIAPGTYEENLDLSISSLTLQGEETARTIIEPNFTAEPLLSISNSSNVIIQNLTFSVGDIAINAENVSSLVVRNNVFSLHDDAIALRLDGLSRGEIGHNVFHGNNTAIERNNESFNIINNIFSENNTAISGDGAQVEYNCFYRNEFRGEQGSPVVLAEDGDPMFASVSQLDFHLRQNSPCIDEGDGNGSDAIDDTDADMGAYGGQFADATPFPVQSVTAADTTAAVDGPFSIQVAWQPNNSYLVTHDSSPGGYLLYYDSDESGEPYEGTSAGDSPIDVGNVTSFELSNLSVDSVVPSTPDITNISPSNKKITIQWSSVATATSYTLHYGVNDVTEETISDIDALSYTLDNLVNGTTYIFAVSAQAQAQYFIALKAYDSTDDENESAFSSEVTVNMGDVRNSDMSAPETGIPEAVVPFPDLPDEGCFIATAAFGYYSAPQVQWLRDFRDQHLKRYPVGRLLIDVYYSVSPTLAGSIKQSEWLRDIVRIALSPFVIFSGLFVTWQFNLLMVVILLTGGFYFFRRRVSNREVML